VSKHKKSDNKWIAFPDQNTLHLNFHKEDDEIKDIVKPDQFWQTHGSLLGLDVKSEMTLLKQSGVPGVASQSRKYRQSISSVRVFGGDFHMTVGLHGGVLDAHGLPLQLSGDELNSFRVEEVLNTPVDVDKVYRAIEQHVSLRQSLDIKLSGSRSAPVELVWHMSKMSVGKQGEVSLAYYVNGVAEESMLTFDAFVDAKSYEVLQFIDKSGQFKRKENKFLPQNVRQNVPQNVPPVSTSVSKSSSRELLNSESPFVSPISDASVFVYDQYLKDYNDDKNDNYYHQDPDRYSSATLVFDTTSGSYTYPTTDAEMNLLIDNTLYVKYLYYSLSGGDYLTWDEVDTNLNIEYNLSISNAYFDGHWGIHFGTGYITDDVVSHEWSHGYTQTGCGLIYEMEPGAMNEAFSDIFGESVDILNADSLDPDDLRTEWPTQCHATLNSGIPPGSDLGTRWSMGENVTTKAPNNDGSIRDMYKPECFFNPGDTYSDYYVCTTYSDSGGVHQNSGVLNRLFAVLTDGGDYADPYTPAVVRSVAGLGIVKSTNLFWRTHQTLTPASQFLDFALALSSTCQTNMGLPLYYPNVFNSSIYVAAETLTAADCASVDVAIAGSGMDSTDDLCPNLDCNSHDLNCVYGTCPVSDFKFNYEKNVDINDPNMVTYLVPPCIFGGTSTFARVFSQSDFVGLDQLNISCIQFAFYMLGAADVTVTVYIDSNGGVPDYDSMRTLHVYDAQTINAGGNFQSQTVSADPFPVNFLNADETLVVVLSMPSLSEGYIYGAGSVNAAAVGTVGETYVGGCVASDFVTYHSWATNNNVFGHAFSATANNQWYVSITGSGDAAGVTSSGAVGIRACSMLPLLLLQLVLLLSLSVF